MTQLPLVGLLVRDDLAQVKRVEAIVAPGAWISHLVLLEATWVLASVYGAKPSQITAAVGMLLEHETLVLQDPDVVSAALGSFAGSPSVSFSDCLIVEVARKAGHLPLGTFDRALSRIDGASRL